MLRLLLALAFLTGCRSLMAAAPSAPVAPSAVAGQPWPGDYVFEETTADSRAGYHLQLAGDRTGTLDVSSYSWGMHVAVRGDRDGDRLAVVATEIRPGHSAATPVVGDTLFTLAWGSDGGAPALTTRWRALRPLRAETPRAGRTFEHLADPAGGALSARGAGPLEIGATTAEAAAAVVPLRVAEFIGECAYAQPYGGPYGLGVMVTEDEVARVEVGPDSGVRMDNGLRVGSTEAEVRRTYGDRLTAEPHVNADLDGGRVAVFETDQAGVVTAFRVGRAPEVHYVEGCL